MGLSGRRAGPIQNQRRVAIVSSAASYELKERVKAAIDIVDLVGNYLALRREGRGFKALCPWHDDTRPSLQVNPERQSFKCWVCDIGGDIFSFIMKMEGVEFPQALAMLADRANIRLQPASGPSTAPADEKRTLYQAMAWGIEQYHQRLAGGDAAAAREYLADRHVSPESIGRFQLGVAPDDWSWLVARASGTPYTAGMLERVGLVGRRKQGPGYYDRFRGRLLFPIFDSQGRAVGLGGRVMPGEQTGDAAKYVNSPETPLFAKSKLLYALNLARDPIRKTGTALVVEGYTDCIAAHQAGFENTVAVLGTALGAEHVQLLRRFADRVKVVLVLDGDEAGRRRASEVLELFVAGNVDLRVLTLPDDMDPAEFLAERGAEAFAALVAAAPDALEHAFRTATAGIDIARDTHRASVALEELVGTIARRRGCATIRMRRIACGSTGSCTACRCDFRVPAEQVRELMTAQRRKTAARARPRTEAADASVRGAIDPLERELLEIVLHLPALMEQVASVVQPAQFAVDECRRVFVECGRCWSAGILPGFERLLLEIDDPVVKNLLVELDESGRRKAATDAELRLRDVLAGFERRLADERMRGRTQALKDRQLAEEEELAVLLELEQLHRRQQQQQAERARHGISDPTDG